MFTRFHKALKSVAVTTVAVTCITDLPQFSHDELSHFWLRLRSTAIPSNLYLRWYSYISGLSQFLIG
jgi:hypothetical protein